MTLLRLEIEATSAFPCWPLEVWLVTRPGYCSLDSDDACDQEKLIETASGLLEPSAQWCIKPKYSPLNKFLRQYQTSLVGSLSALLNTTIQQCSPAYRHRGSPLSWPLRLWLRHTPKQTFRSIRTSRISTSLLALQVPTSVTLRYSTPLALLLRLTAF